MSDNTEIQSTEHSRTSGDLTVTALYTAQTWRWGRLPNGELFDSRASRAVFGVVNIVLAVMKMFSWKLKSLRHSLLHRHAMIDALVAEAQPEVVIELAAGLSRRGVTVSADERIQYWEVDLSHVIAKKRALLQRSANGKRMLQRANHHLVSSDVQTADLASMSTAHAKRVYIAEGLCMYLKPNEQRSLWAKIASDMNSAAGPAFFVFDLVPWCEQPKPGWIGHAFEWMMKRFTKGQSFSRDQRTRQDIVQDLQRSGFHKVDTLEPRDVAQRWQLPYPQKSTQQLLFVCGNAAAEPVISELKVESGPQ